MLRVLCCKPMNTTLHCFVKTGEWFERTVADKIFDRNDTRARQIFGPDSTLKGFPGYYNRAMLQVMKKITKSFICGYNMTKLAEVYTKDIRDLN